MAFPDDPRDLKVSFAFGSSAMDDPPLQTYTTVSPGGAADDPGPVKGVLTITRGRVGDSGTTDSTRISLSLDNDGGDFSKRNVSGPYYGLLRQGTWMKAAVDIGDGDWRLAAGAVPDWNPIWDGPGINQRVPINTVGLLALLGQDQTVYSALRLDISYASNIQAYWPMEDSEGATVFGSAVAAAPAMAFGAIDDSQDSDLPGSLPLPIFTAQTELDGTITGSFTAGSWSHAWVAKFVTAPPSLTTLMEVTATGGSAVRWVLAADSTTIYLTGYSAAGAAVHTASLVSPSTYSSWFSGEWVTLLWTVDSGSAGVTATPMADDVGFGLDITDVTISPGTPTRARMPKSANLAGSSVGHMATYDGAGAISSSVMRGYVGDSAARRASITCFTAGVPHQISSSQESAAMGPQKPATILALLRDCEAADHGVLYETRNGRLDYQANSARYNLAVSATFAFEDIADLIQFDDDRDLRNQITVSRVDGSSATVVQTTGTAGTDSVGPRLLTPSALSLYQDTQLPDQAAWLLRHGTIDRPRYALTVNPFAVSTIRSDVVTLDIGKRIQVTGAPAEHVGPDTLDLIIEGEAITIGANAWIVTWWCEPYEPWRVQQFANTPPDDDLLDGWLIPDSFSLASGVTTTATSWSGDIEPLMTTNPDDFPCRVQVDGEEVWITACSGASSPQTFTVTRSVNGITKAHNAGAQIELLDPLILTL